MSAKTLLTVEEFERLDPPDGTSYELDEGELVAMTFPAPRHNAVVIRIIMVLGAFLRSHDLGRLFAPDAGFHLSRDPDTLRGPDVAFLRTERARLIDPDSWRIAGAPDLAVEVVSPSDTVRGLNRKVHQYLKAGAQTVWVVFPVEQEVHIFRQGGAMQVLTAGDTLDDPDLLPGFSTPVSALFE